MKLTKVQERVLAQLALEPGGRAMVGRGLLFKCNRITARALRDLGLVTTDTKEFLSHREDEVPFFVELTPDGLNTAASAALTRMKSPRGSK